MPGMWQKSWGCSTQPIYLCFQNMEDLKAAMTQQADCAAHTICKRVASYSGCGLTAGYRRRQPLQQLWHRLGEVRGAGKAPVPLAVSGGRAARPSSRRRTAAGDHCGHRKRVRIFRGTRRKAASGHDILLRAGDSGEYGPFEFDGCRTAGFVSQRIHSAGRKDHGVSPIPLRFREQSERTDVS